MQLNDTTTPTQHYNIHVEKNLQFYSQSDNLAIHYDIYMPTQDTHQNPTYPNLYTTQPTIIQIAHGMVEHKERYQWLCSCLAQHGYIVAISDHRGHGKSIDSSHPWGEMGGISTTNTQNNTASDIHQDGFQKAIDDLYTLTQIICARFPNHRFILLGHSMGSLLSRGYLKKYGEMLHGLILSGSPAYNPLLGVGIMMAQFLRFIGAKEQGKKFINNLSFGGFNKPFAKEDLNAQHSTGAFAWLSRDWDNVRAYRADEACQFIFSLESFIGLFRGILWLQEPLSSTSKLMQKTLPKPPIYMISGASDSCGDFGKGVQKIAQKLQGCGFVVTLQLYPEARHEIFQEINKHEVLHDLLTWLHDMIKAK